MVTLILLVLAFVLLALAAFGVNAPKINFGWAGLALLSLADLLGRTSWGGTLPH
jgi:hypothetical protein